MGRPLSLEESQTGEWPEPKISALSLLADCSWCFLLQLVCTARQMTASTDGHIPTLNGMSPSVAENRT